MMMKQDPRAAMAAAKMASRAPMAKANPRAMAAAMMAKQPMKPMKPLVSRGFAKGGKVDGCATRGKTKAKNF